MSDTVINNLMDFNPSEMDAYAEKVRSNSLENFYTPKTSETKSEDKNYYATIRFIPNVNNPKKTIISKTTYNLTDGEGFFSVDSLLTNGDTNCPLFKTWKSLHYGKDAILSKLADEVFNKVETHYVLIQVIEDVNHPELNGKFLIWKLPVKIKNKIDNKLKPSVESKKKAENVFDPFVGRNLLLEIRGAKRDTSYEFSEFDTEKSCIIDVNTKEAILNEADQDVIDKFNKELEKLSKELAKGTITQEEAIAKRVTLNGYKRVTELYANISNYIKENIPNLEEETAFVPMNEYIETRVNNFIATVKSGINPKDVIVNNDSQTNNNTASTNNALENMSFNSPAIEALSEENDPNDDLPF